MRWLKKPKAYALIIDPKDKNWLLSVWIAFLMLALPLPVHIWKKLLAPILMVILDFILYFLNWGYLGIAGRLGRTPIDPKILKIKEDIERRLNKPDV